MEGTTMRAWLTADVTTPDGSDTNCYGEPCEEGAGYTLESGWLYPNGSVFEVFEEREDGMAILKDADDERTDEGWQRELITRYLGMDDGHGGTGTFYSADAVIDYRTGQESVVAIHFEA